MAVPDRPDFDELIDTAWGDWVHDKLTLGNVRCIVSSTTATNASSGVMLPWSTDLHDPLNMHDPAVNPSRITMPAGMAPTWFKVGCNLSWSIAGGGTVRQFAVFVNGTAKRTHMIGAAGGGGDTYIAADMPVLLSGGQYVEIFAFGGVLLSSATYPHVGWVLPLFADAPI